MAEEIYSAQTIDIKNPFVPYAVAKLIAGILALLISLWTLIVIQGRVSTALGIGKSNGLFHRPQHGVSPHAPHQRLASPVGSRQATGPRRRARTGRVAGDGQPALLGLLGGTDANYYEGLL